MTHTRISLPYGKSVAPYALLMRFFIVLIVFLVFIVLIFTYTSVKKQNKALSRKLDSLATSKNVSAPISTPSASNQQTSLVPVDQAEVEALLEKVNTLAILPQDEAPTLATIVDIEKLGNDAFFRDGANDDKVFVYQASGIVLLYRPSEGKIVNMGNILGTSGRREVRGASQQKSASSEAGLEASEEANIEATAEAQVQ